MSENLAYAPYLLHETLREATAPKERPDLQGSIRANAIYRMVFQDGTEIVLTCHQGVAAARRLAYAAVAERGIDHGRIVTVETHEGGCGPSHGRDRRNASGVSSAEAARRRESKFEKLAFGNSALPEQALAK